MKLTDPQIHALASRLLSTGFPKEPSPLLRAAATATGSLPVAADMGGVVLIGVDGKVIVYDFESGASKVVVEERWRRAAAIRAAQKYPELSALVPARTPTDQACSGCGGKGKILSSTCGVCLGLGWIWREPI